MYAYLFLSYGSPYSYDEFIPCETCVVGLIELLSVCFQSLRALRRKHEGRSGTSSIHSLSWLKHGADEKKKMTSISRFDAGSGSDTGHW